MVEMPIISLINPFFMRPASDEKITLWPIIAILVVAFLVAVGALVLSLFIVV